MTVSGSCEPKTDAPIRLALVSTELGVGGAEKCATMLAQGIRQYGFQPEVVSLAAPPSPGHSRFIRELESAGIPVHFIGVDQPSQFLRGVSRLTRLLRQMQPHILQSFLFHANIVSAWAARRARVPYTFAGLRVAEPEKWRWRLLRLAASQVQQFVCVSQSVADFAVSSGLPAGKLAVIPNAVDVEQIQDLPPTNLQTLGIASGRRAILCVARFERQKGVDWLLEQAHSILEQLPEFDLVLAGSGTQFESARQFVNSQDWHQRVHLLGQRDDVPELMKACDLVVLPSRWEGMPNVLLEAMACRRPVVAHQVQGVVELLGPLAIEQSVKPDQPVDFVKKVVALSTNMAKSASLGDANSQRVAKHFTVQQLCAAYARQYLTHDQCHPNLPGKKYK